MAIDLKRTLAALTLAGAAVGLTGCGRTTTPQPGVSEVKPEGENYLLLLGSQRYEEVKSSTFNFSTFLDCEFGRVVTTQTGGSVLLPQDSEAAKTARAKCRGKGIEPGF